jgi:PTH1 family peptidyl-tRNA hydrolase
VDTTLLVGLGNPGPDHAGQRHNVGFRALDRIAQRHGFASPRPRFHGLAADGRIGERRVLALKPLTYMNRSGEAVAAAAKFYKLSPDDIIVLYDEIDFAPGKMRARRGGGAAGHNGIRSIDDHIGPDFWRIRIGVGHPGHKDLVSGYVLHDFAKSDLIWLDPLLDAIADEIGSAVDHKAELFMTRVAARLAPPKPAQPGKAPGTPAGD